MVVMWCERFRSPCWKPGCAGIFRNYIDPARVSNSPDKHFDLASIFHDLDGDLVSLLLLLGEAVAPLGDGRDHASRGMGGGHAAELVAGRLEAAANA